MLSYENKEMSIGKQVFLLLPSPLNVSNGSLHAKEMYWFALIQIFMMTSVPLKCNMDS